MIDQLRKRFVKIAVIGSLVVVAIFLSTIILSNYYMTRKNENHVLKTLTSYYAKTGTTVTFDSDVPYESRYFVMIYDASGNLIEMNTTKVAAIKNSEAMKYGMQAYKQKSQNNRLDYLRYAKTKHQKETIIVFLNCATSIQNFKELIIYSISISLAGLLVFTLLILTASKRIVRPFAIAQERQRTFISDAGHDLKTPITIIDADSEVLKSKYGDDEWVLDIQHQAYRMKTLTEDLIFLSKLDEHPTYQMIDFPISDILAEIAQSYASLAKTQHKAMHITIEPNLSFCGDQKNIERLMTILLDNAVKYSPRHGEIQVTLEKQKKFLVFTVYNTTDNIKREDLPKLFDRFYRSDKSRNSETGGYGIGLSIAKSVVEAHKGKIHATTSDEKSLAMIVILPVS
ncbi:two-component sensor histidine kinase [Intestinibaculum porci]|uniref:histidine kinase n=1 Tax=Intestinibaculum porci TaxID=2487118 RepID=A0A3G9J9G2_9FIRM|nr:HAMP domain-containing sensor histidine kinase [Intestinibaculum porci]BBH27182.1 two-component sensor histidine kinase [Intestinibaculum porci]